MQEIRIRDEFVTLGQFLKLAGLIGTGGEAKQFLAGVGISVNGEPDNRRGRKIRVGDIVAVEGAGEFRVVVAGSFPADD
jgi:ribosome-associated protein